MKKIIGMTPISLMIVSIMNLGSPPANASLLSYLRTLGSVPCTPEYLPIAQSSTWPQGSLFTMENNLQLAAQVPMSLGIESHAMSWSVQPLDHSNNQLYKLAGQYQQMTLPMGRYQVRLHIGFYEENRIVRMENSGRLKEVFVAKIGRLRASANEAVIWRIQSETDGKTFVIENKRTINVIVPSGIYKISADLSGLVRAERLRINTGENRLSELFVPAGKVNLIATRENAPLFRPTTWNVYRLESGERSLIGTYQRHVREVIVPPGHYVVVAESENVIRSREFWVKSGTINDIAVPMD